MSRCAVKRGFFVLRACGASSQVQCAVCQRTVCARHLAKDVSPRQCLECISKKRATDDSFDWHEDDGDTFFAYRHHYYTQHSYHPVLLGAYSDSYYDSYDLRAFDSDLSDDGGYDDSDDGFLDS